MRRQRRRRARAELARRERDRGRTIYAIARELGVTQNAVRRMLGLRGVRDDLAAPRAQGPTLRAGIGPCLSLGLGVRLPRLNL